jgi:hypothetical protein
MRLGRFASTVLALAVATPVAAAETGKIAVEFNDLQPAESGCRAVFVLNNGLDKPLDKLALRVVAFDTAEHATLFLTLDVGALPVGKTRVLRFDLGAGVTCDSIGKLVLDDVTSCEGAGLDPAACLAAVSLSSKAKAPFAF